MRLIGVGNPWRRDDGFGPMLVDSLQQKPGNRWQATKAGSEAIELLELLKDNHEVLIVDAMSMDDFLPGDLALFQIDATSDLRAFCSRASSTHGIGVFELLRLCIALLDEVPTIYVLGAQGIDFSDGYGLSPLLEDRLNTIVEYLAQVKEIRECMNMPYLKTCWPKSKTSPSSIERRASEV